jgi:hypothetical protein
MAVSLEAIIPTALVAGAILAHAYISQPPRYQFLWSASISGKLIRGDTHTGLAIVCVRDYMPDDTEFYDCSPPTKAEPAPTTPGK